MRLAEIDVRSLPPCQRRPLVLAAFDLLGAGETTVIVADGDLADAREQLRHERPDGHVWDYLERGPRCWRVRLARR